MTAFPTDVNHKGEPELANRGHEVAFIGEFSEKRDVNKPALNRYFKKLRR